MSSRHPALLEKLYDEDVNADLASESGYNMPTSAITQLNTKKPAEDIPSGFYERYA